MAINISTQPTTELYYDGDAREFVAQFEDEGCHFYLCYLFQTVEEKVGREIDLWSGVVFSGSALKVLRDVLTSARASLALQPDTWTESAGLASPGESSSQEEVYVSLNKQEITKMLNTIEATTEKVMKGKSYLAIYGD